VGNDLIAGLQQREHERNSSRFAYRGQLFHFRHADLHRVLQSLLVLRPNLQQHGLVSTEIFH
jgi:hypothetical protein